MNRGLYSGRGCLGGQGEERGASSIRGRRAASRKTDPKQTDNTFILKVKHIYEMKSFRYSYLLPNCCSVMLGSARSYDSADLMTAEAAADAAATAAALVRTANIPLVLLILCDDL